MTARDNNNGGTKMATKFKTVRTKADIEADPRTEGPLEREVHDGWWISLVDGWTMEARSDVHGLHEANIKDLCWMLNNTVTRCAPECRCGNGGAA